MGERRRVVIVGGGFAGLACAKKLSGRPDIDVTIIDRNDYHQFQPLLYQVATSMLSASDVAYPLRRFADVHGGLGVKLEQVESIDPVARTVTTERGTTYEADDLVLAAGSQPFFFKTPGADEHAFPLYSLDHATRLRSRILELFEEADRDPSLVDQGALEFVVVGGGPTGVEVSGALAEMIQTTLASEYRDLAVRHARVTLVDHGHALLKPFSDKAHDYAAKALGKDGVRLRLGTGVSEVGPGHVTLSDGSTIQTRCVIWGGGITAAPVAAKAGLPTSRGGRIDVEPDLTVEGFPGVHVIGDIANIPSPDGSTFPQLGSVAQQSGTWAAKNIIAGLDGKSPRPFHYLDKGIMAMIGRGSAVAEVSGIGHHELQGPVAFAAWLGVHAALMSGFRNRVDAFVDWGWDYFGRGRGPQILDRSDAARIQWDDDGAPAGDPTSATATPDTPATAATTT
jgi:NADH dehydrogenase